jgi:hypothetical protein
LSDAVWPQATTCFPRILATSSKQYLCWKLETKKDPKANCESRLGSQHRSAPVTEKRIEKAWPKMMWAKTQQGTAVFFFVGRQAFELVEASGNKVCSWGLVQDSIESSKPTVWRRRTNEPCSQKPSPYLHNSTSCSCALQQKLLLPVGQHPSNINAWV